MSELKIGIPLRPCYVARGDEEVKALFHRWCDTIIRDKQTVSVAAIVELEDGTIHTAYPENITFLDNQFLQYTFPIDWIQVKNENDEMVYLPRDHYYKEENND